MVRYRRDRIAGATHFFTVTLRDRRSDLLVREIDALRQAGAKAAGRTPHTAIAAVVLPDHLRAVIRMEDQTADFPRLWQDIKKGLTWRTSQLGHHSHGNPATKNAPCATKQDYKLAAVTFKKKPTQAWARQRNGGLAALHFPSLCQQRMAAVEFGRRRPM